MGIFLNLESMKTEVVNEQRVYTGQGICIEIDPSDDRYGYYFKVYNSESPSKAKKVARFDVSSPEYEYHSTPGKKIWDMNRGELKTVIDALESESKYIDGSVWDDIVRRCKATNQASDISISSAIPDYINIVFDKKKGNKFK